MTEPLSVLDTIKFATEQIWTNRVAISKLIVFSGLVNGFIAWLVVNQADSSVTVWVYAFLAGGVYTLLAVNVHRLILKANNRVVLYPWTWRETRFMGWLALIYFYFGLLFVLGVAVIALPSGYVLFQNGGWTDELLWALVTLPGGYLVVRLSLLLPATALDRRHRMAWAWKHTEGNGWRLLALLWLLSMLISNAIPDMASDVSALFVVWHIIIATGTTLEIALLSAVFNTLAREDLTPSQVTQP